MAGAEPALYPAGQAIVSAAEASRQPSAALRALLTGLIDYAGLFPPAGLGMEDAVRNYASYVNGEHAEYSWMLGRFILPAARLHEFREAVEHTGVDTTGWRLSVLASGGTHEAAVADRGKIADWAHQHSDNADRASNIDTLEIRAASAEEIKQAALIFEGRYQLYFEIPPQQWTALLQTVGVAHARAKIRTGGEAPAAIPPEGSVLQFLRLASERRLAFKATAGLHHPLRAMQRLTYKEDSPAAVMHGFVNVFAAATLLWHEPKMSQEAAWILAERDADAITMDGDTMTWQNSSVTLTTEQIRTARERFAISFGSCSFIEPVTDLRALGWL
jgi:hypothetical protein